MKTASANLCDGNLKNPLILILLVVLSCLAARDAAAQGPKQFLSMPSFGRSQSQSTPSGQTQDHQRTMHLYGIKKMTHEKLDPDRDHLTTIPHWTGEFSYHGITYPYTMVGTDPSKGSATTVVPTVIIPLRFVFADGSVIDSSTDLVDGQTAIHGIINSPIFKPYPFVSGGTHVGNTQWGDAAQRANFWNYVSTRSPDYHVLLGQPTVLPVQTINVPADQGGYADLFGIGEIVPYVDFYLLDQQRQALSSQLGITACSLPIFVTGRVFNTFGNYHGAENISSGKDPVAGAQTYIVTGYFSQSSVFGEVPDISSLSHELSEWLSDPFTNNYTPGWDIPLSTSAQCDSGTFNNASDRLEVCDPLDPFDPESLYSLPLNSFTYHVEDRVFLDFFTRAARSNSINGQFSFFGLVTSPSSPCTGHLEVEHTLFAVPGAVSTTGHGINNRGEVVGYYFDASFNRHGFSFDKSVFTSIDFPGATDTAAQKVNDSGLVVGWFDKADGVPHGFSYKNGVYATIDFPGSIDTIADGVNAEGDVVGGYDDANFVTHGFVLHNGRYLRTDAPYALQTQLSSINDEGQAAGFTWDDQFNGPFVGLVKNGNTFSMVNYPGAQFTYPFSINNSSMLTGQFFNANGYGDGFVTLFGFPYEIYGFVFGNNEKGQIAGTTYDSNGQQVGFTAQLPTKPADR